VERTKSQWRLDDVDVTVSELNEWVVVSQSSTTSQWLGSRLVDVSSQLYSVVYYVTVTSQLVDLSSQLYSVLLASRLLRLSDLAVS